MVNFYFLFFYFTDNEIADGESFTRDRRRLIENHDTYGARESTMESAISSLSNLGGTTNYSNILSLNRVKVFLFTFLLKKTFFFKLYPPGHLLRMQFDANHKVEMNWVDVDYLSVIHLTSAMFTDHWPKKVRKVLRQAKAECSHNV